MDRILKSSRFDANPEDASAAKLWNHWFRTFENFLATLQTGTAENPVQVSDATKLQVLVNYVASEVFEYISDCETYTSAIKTLKDIYVKQ